MGCDIHAYIEIRQDGKWEHYDWQKQYQIGTYEDGSPEYDYDKLWDNPLGIGRNYDLFAILANVRNGHGFAGILTGTGFEPMDKPRGLPQDVSLEVRAESDEWNGDGHSHSWMSLPELLGYDYEGKSTTRYGVVSQSQYQEFKLNGKPSQYSGDVWGQRIKKISNAEMDEFLTGNSELSQEFEYYTTVQWQETYKEAVGEQWFRTLEELSKLGSPESIRLVFWFDN